MPLQGSFFQGWKESLRLVTLVVHILFPKGWAPAATGIREANCLYLTFIDARHSSR